MDPRGHRPKSKHLEPPEVGGAKERVVPPEFSERGPGFADSSVLSFCPQNAQGETSVVSSHRLFLLAATGNGCEHAESGRGFRGCSLSSPGPGAGVRPAGNRELVITFKSSR